MKATWDEPKRRVNLLKHGFDLAEFDEAFDAETALFRPTHPSRNGRTRFLLVGQWNNVVVVAVIVSPLGTQGLDVVSVRHASSKERAAYEQHRAQTRGGSSGLYPGGLG